MKNKQIIFIQRPKGMLEPAKAFKIVTSTLSTTDVSVNYFLVRIIYLSLDPAMRGRMNDTRSYIPPVTLNTVMRAGAVGQVIFSKNTQFKLGDYVQGTFGMQEYAISNGKGVKVFNNISDDITLLQCMGVYGMTGLTAYFGFLDVGKPKPGETVVVSGAAGATGSVVVQIAKAVGCRVVGIAGSDEKVKWLKDLGCDEALNYQDPLFKKKLTVATPKFIDVYFDNVGGEILDLCLRRLAFKGRVVVCGAISQYNSTEPKGPGSYLTLISQRGRMEGFIVFDYSHRYVEARKQLSKWISEGKILQKETVVAGLENAPNAMLELFKGGGSNIGKLLIKVSEEKLPIDAKL